MMKKLHDLNDMMAFLTVIDAGSFTLAAEHMGIPKANLSRKISRLEQELGVILLERSTRSQHLTEAGKHYLSHCRHIHHEMDLAEVTISQMLNHVKGKLRIGVSVSVGHQIIKPVLSQFMHQYPDIHMELHLLNRRIDLIEGGFDLLIRVGELQDSRLIRKKLGQIKRKIYASSHYLEQHDPIKNINDLHQHDFLLMSDIHNAETLLLYSDNEEQKITIQPKLRVNDFLFLQQSVLDGLGIAILPDYMCHKEFCSGKLINILPEWGMKDVDIYALYPRHRLKIPKVKAFLDFIVDSFKLHMQ